MKFNASKDKLLEGLAIVQNVVSARTTLPILSNVLLEAIDGEIRLTTTDLDVGIRGSIEAQVERTGATTLPARRLLSIVRELPSSEIYFDVDAKNLASIRSGSSSRFLDCQKKSFRLWLVLKRQRFSRSLKKM
jgi:DNA polymerase III subunit beta